MIETKKEESPKEILGFLNILIIILSIYVLIVLLFDTFFKLPIELSRLLSVIDIIICSIFLFDFVLRFYKSESKLQFMKWGWIDLIASIPTLDIFRAGRTLRLIRLIRILRAFRSTKHIIHHIYSNRAEGAFKTVAIIAIVMVLFSSIAILQFEDSPTSNIKTAEDAIWWACATITTVGYGDHYPVTTEGRVVAVFLMVTGVGFVGVFSGFVASWFIKGSEIENSN